MQTSFLSSFRRRFRGVLAVVVLSNFVRIMAEFALGKYKMEASENFDEYMKALGVGVVMRKLGNAATPTMEITVNGDEYELKTITTFKTTSIKFKLGEEFEENTADGRVVKSTITVDGNTLIHEQKGNKEKKEKDSVLRRTFDGNTCKLVCEADGVTANRVYKKEA